jgi:hypothetical protein
MCMTQPSPCPRRHVEDTRRSLCGCQSMPACSALHNLLGDLSAGWADHCDDKAVNARDHGLSWCTTQQLPYAGLSDRSWIRLRHFWSEKSAVVHGSGGTAGALNSSWTELEATSLMYWMEPEWSCLCSGQCQKLPIHALNEARSYLARVLGRAGSGLACVADSVRSYLSHALNEARSYLAPVLGRAGSGLACVVDSVRSYLSHALNEARSYFAPVLGRAGSDLACVADSARSYLSHALNEARSHLARVLGRAGSDLACIVEIAGSYLARERDRTGCCWTVAVLKKGGSNTVLPAGRAVWCLPLRVCWVLLCIL